MVNIHKELVKQNLLGDCHLVLQIHDELLFEVKNESLLSLQRLIKDQMEQVLCGVLRVPMRVNMKAGFSWGSMNSLVVDK